MLTRRLLLAAASGGAFPGWTRGTLSVDGEGSRVTILADGMHNAFPGIVRLDSTRCLLVYRRATGHAEVDGDIYGTIGTITGYTVSWGSGFLIYHNPDDYDARGEDAVSIVDGNVVILGRLYDGTESWSPFVLVCDELPAVLTSSSTWSIYGIPLTSGDLHDAGIGRMIKTDNSTYLVGFNDVDAPFTSRSGVLLSSSYTDWSAMTTVPIGTGANKYTEIDVEKMPGGSLVAHMRTEVPLDIFVSTSTDHGVTWSAPSSLFDGFGYPMWRRWASGLQLSVHRPDSSPYDAVWRQSDDDGATWSAETVLDDSFIADNPSDMAYATLLFFDSTHALCVYAIEDERNGVWPSNLYSQVFTDSSTR